MKAVVKRKFLTLFLGDLLFFYIALWLTLFLRHFEIPEAGLFESHILPFSILFIFWAIVFFASGLYDHHTLIFKKKLPSRILKVQFFNIFVAGIFFFLIPYFGISPKTNLVIYLVISFVLLYSWRLVFAKIPGRETDRHALLIGGEKEIFELKDEVNGNHYGFKFTHHLDKKMAVGELSLEVERIIEQGNYSEIVIDFNDRELSSVLSVLNRMAFKGIRVFDANLLYEELFGRIPLSCLREDWVFEKVSIVSKPIYDFLKRIFDFCVAFVLFLISLLFYLPVVIFIKLEDKGPIFIVQERAGQNGRVIRLRKFRSMTSSEDGVWLGESGNKVTKIGKIIRKFRIDELPQLLNVLNGDISLIGPRPDILGLEKRLKTEIPFYHVRYMIKPGLSGWAQVKQDVVPQSIEETKDRLSYDLYYIKNRSVSLDVSITLRTIKTVISRAGV